MNFFVIILGIIFTIFSTAVLSYISMTTMMGPWIAPVIILMSSVVLKIRKILIGRESLNREIALIQTVGSVGGIIAVGVGFSLPTLYFLDATIFNNFIKNPFSFSLFIAIMCFCAGGLGIWLARCLASKFIIKENLTFPVSQLIYNMIISQTQQKQAKNMFLGLGVSWVIGVLRDGFLHFKGIFPKVYYLFSSFAGKHIEIVFSPMFWAIGFIAGIRITLPLLVGMLSKYLILHPLNNHSTFLPFKFFLPLADYDFVTAFCGGLVASELIFGLLTCHLFVKTKIKNYSCIRFFAKLKDLRVLFVEKISHLIKKRACKKTYKDAFALVFAQLEPIFVLFGSAGFFYYAGFSVISLILLLTFIILATRQISYMGAKIGMVTFGRFATFIMIPMMMLFHLDFVQITLLCVFFNICAASACDLLFDYKVGQLCGIHFKQISRYQWFGLLITSLCIGIFLWLLFTNLQLGSPELFAQRGRTRALLIQSLHFDLYVVFLGILYGLALKKLKMSPTLVLGGILMPNHITFGLVLGTLFSTVSGRVENQFPFWCGIFSGESVWVTCNAIAKMFR